MERRFAQAWMNGSFKYFFPQVFEVLFVQVKIWYNLLSFIKLKTPQKQIKKSSNKFYNTEHTFQDSLPFCRICTNERVKMFGVGNTVTASYNILIQPFFKLRKKNISFLPIHT